MHLYLGIDGGGTACRAAVADQAGVILGRSEAGPANIASNPDAARDSILKAAQAALHSAFGHTRDMTRLHAGLGLAGANAAGAAGQLRLALPFARVRIETDAMTALRGALGPADGIVAALGTGSVFAVRYGGQIRQFGGWGLMLGDEASGAWIGRAALQVALRAQDGLTPDTAFLQDLRDRHGGAAGIVRFATVATPSAFATLAPEVAASDDPAAHDIMLRAVGEIRIVLDHLRRGTNLPVTFIGGLGPVYAQLLPDIPQREAVGTALDGALSLAREAA